MPPLDPLQRPEPATAPKWTQLTIDCGQRAAGSLLASVAPYLLDDGTFAAWWFIRKRQHLRLRLRPVEPDGTGPAEPASSGEAVAGLIRAARAAGALDVVPAIYEPEIDAFGGPAAMELAHDGFSADSRHLLRHLTAAPEHPLRRELALLLSVRLLRAAGLEWEEQGDVWSRVAAHRPDPGAPPPATVRAVRALLTSTADHAGSPLARDPAWSTDLEDLGRQLAALAADGRLTRGLRAVLAHHLLFLFNRHGVHADEQAVIAAAAIRATFDEETTMTTPHHPAPDPPTGPRVPGAADAAATSSLPAHAHEPTDSQARRDELADTIRRRGGFRVSRVEQAFRTVSRHDFLPGVPLDQAYAPRPVVILRDRDGVALSSASSPTLVAEMLELLDVHPGDRVLEIGSATGFNAALLAELTGASGHVVTVELDSELANGARANLARTRYAERVTVLRGDGALGAPEQDPFDRIIVTAGATDVPAAWWDQLTDSGRLVVPLQLHSSGLTRALCLDRHDSTTMISTEALVCGFVPLRAEPSDPTTPATDHASHDPTAPDDARETVTTQLAGDVVLDHACADRGHVDGLSDALTAGTRWQRWLDRDVPHAKGPAGHLDLWLATQTASRFARLRASAAARDAGLAEPAPRWSGACVIDRGSLAYLTVRDRPGSDDAELGVTAIGEHAEQLGQRLADEVTRWHDGPQHHDPTIVVERTRDGRESRTAVYWPDGRRLRLAKPLG